ncbi:polyprenol monophosphomannose synthase [Candidatus Woesearchaeota archaeon]|nr:polyprenol monophosphomannose synthase [Candidatus Woesearchaeota archaeon]
MVSSEIPFHKLAVVCATYNEADNITELVKQVLVFPCHLVVVDDNSPDGTSTIISALQKGFKNLHLIKRAGKLGYGSAYVEGFRYALNVLKADFVVSIDADLSHEPGVIPELARKAQNFDVVIGSRYVSGGGTSWTLHRKLMSFSANFLARLFLGIPAHDMTSGYRCYSAKVIRAIDFSAVKSDGYSFLQEILYRVHKQGFSIAEVPIFFRDRREGKSKLSKKEIFNFFRNLVRLRFGY